MTARLDDVIRAFAAHRAAHHEQPKPPSLFADEHEAAVPELPNPCHRSNQEWLGPKTRAPWVAAGMTRQDWTAAQDVHIQGAEA